MVLAAGCRTAAVIEPGEMSLEVVRIQGTSATLRLVNASHARFVFRTGAPVRTAAIYESSLGVPSIFYVVDGCGAGTDQTLKPGKSVEFVAELPKQKSITRAKIRIGVQQAGGGFIVWAR